ncbi:MAG: 2-C-methyl-D-erythritol 2,4-cyclodiphosphate synthase [Desulfobacterales bacterium]|nr:2-C-methyl-D-erythritol 2,4-cyclodiphosphate synthase [Desulfobacterales bacterium]
MRIGHGYDVHRLIAGRPLFIGGVQIPFEKGLEGHSDADVLLHAICDAILGAAGKGDIGMHFPDTDPAYKNIYSIELLKKTWKIVRPFYSSIINIDTTIFAQEPKISPYADRMKDKIASALSITSDQVNIKATTTEGLGFIGKKEGIAAMCVVLID